MQGGEGPSWQSTATGLNLAPQHPPPRSPPGGIHAPEAGASEARSWPESRTRKGKLHLSQGEPVWWEVPGFSFGKEGLSVVLKENKGSWTPCSTEQVILSVED